MLAPRAARESTAPNHAECDCVSGLYFNKQLFSAARGSGLYGRRFFDC